MCSRCKMPEPEGSKLEADLQSACRCVEAKGCHQGLISNASEALWF